MMKRENNMPQNIFDMIEVYFGNEKITARPFSFTENEHGDFIEPTLASTTCPKCGHGVTIKLLYGINAVCENCNYGSSGQNLNSSVLETDVRETISSIPSLNQIIEDDLETQMMKLLNDDKGISAIKNTITIDEKSGTLKTSCPFIDPIELGLFTTDEI